MVEVHDVVFLATELKSRWVFLEERKALAFVRDKAGQKEKYSNLVFNLGRQRCHSAKKGIQSKLVAQNRSKFETI